MVPSSFVPHEKCMLGKSSCGTTAPLMDHDRTSDVPTVHATWLHETDLQSVWPGVLSLDMGPMCVALGFNVILAVVR